MTHSNLLPQIHLKPLTIVIWGYGAEGQATHRYCLEQPQRHTIIILDDNPVDASQLVAPATVLTGEAGHAAVTDHSPDLLVRSPGITRYHPLLTTLADAGTELTTSTNIWFFDNPAARKLVVTGSKGKSTTSTLIHHTLLQLGFDSRLLGNGGTPLIGQPAGRDFTVLELSSYQTSDLAIAPDSVTITNLFEEHLEWHGSVAQYHHDKWRIADLTPPPTLILNTEDPLSCLRFKTRECTRYFSSNDVTPTDPQPAHINDSSTNHHHTEPADTLLWRDQVLIQNLQVKGTHNHGNLAAALTTVDQAIGGISASSLDYDTLKGLPHRLTEHHLPGDLLCVDDSISTIPQAVLAALSVYRAQPVHLFLGGFDRDVDFSSLTAHFSSREGNAAHVKQLVFFGALGQRLAQEFTGNLVAHTVQLRLCDAITAAFDSVSRGDVLLLSPGGASYDEFSGFAERGDLFVDQCTQAAQAHFE